MTHDKTSDLKSSHEAALKKGRLFYQSLSYFVLILLSVLLFIKAGELPSSKWEPLGASAFPRIILALIIFISLLALLGDIVKLTALKTTRLNISWNSEQNLVVYLFILLGVYLGLTPLLGFKLMTFVFLLSAQFLLGPKTRQSIIISMITAVIFSVGIYALFEHVFNIYLPRSSIF